MASKSEVDTDEVVVPPNEATIPEVAAAAEAPAPPTTLRQISKEHSHRAVVDVFRSKEVAESAAEEEPRPSAKHTRHSPSQRRSNAGLTLSLSAFAP